MPKERSFPFLPVLIAAALVLYAVGRVTNVLIPFVLGFALAYIVDPVIVLFEARGIRRGVAVAALFLAAAGLVALLASTLVQMASSELSLLHAQAPEYLAQGKHFYAVLQKRIASRLPLPPGLARNWDATVFSPLMEQAANLPGYLLGLFPLLSLLFLVPFVSFFLLLDGHRFIAGAIQACPSRYVEQALHLISQIDASLGNYLRGLITIALAITVASFIGLWAMGLNQALAIAVLSGVSSFVPYLGAIMGAVVGGAAAVLQFKTAKAGLEVVGLFVAIRLADETLLQPIIAKHSVHLHPLVFLLSLLIGGELFGFIGLVFAIPAACVLKALGGVVWAWYSSEMGLKSAETFEETAIPYT